ncbi:MAG: VWA domain-containing protein, partial [Candidatus Sumerlaeota bacterium]|nr:VWA domain-containing protein [Candidatus Sumerlaeota bacterium]
MEREQARRIYEDIVRRMRDPGLMEYMDQNLMRVRIFPVPARGDQKVEVEFTQPLPMDAGSAQYVYPIGALERGPMGASDFRFSFSIESDVPIKTVYSPSHRLNIERRSDRRIEGSVDPSTGSTGSPQASSGHPSTGSGQGETRRDVTLVYTVAEGDIGLNALCYREDTEKPGFFMVMIAPKVEMNEADIQSKAVTFVFDTSGSMASDKKIDQARDALKYCLDSLRPKDRFNVVRFASDVDSFRDDLVEANDENRDRARKWVSEMRASGGTNIDEALAMALRSRPSKEFVHTVVLLTDGCPTVGETRPEAILANVEQRNKEGLRVFTFGVGNDVNARFLDRLAEDARAVSQYVRPGEDIEQAVSSFFDKIASPVLTDLELEIQGVPTVDLFPHQLPDLFLGTQLTVFGRYKEPGKAKVVLHGKLGDKRQDFVYEAKFPGDEDRHGYIEPLWGQRKVGYLLEEIRRNGENKEVVDEVVQLAKRYGIVTPYTSYLAVDDAELARAQPIGPMETVLDSSGGPVQGPRFDRMYAAPPAAAQPETLSFGASGNAPEALGRAGGAGLPMASAKKAAAAAAPAGGVRPTPAPAGFVAGQSLALADRAAVQAQTGAEAVEAA